MEFAKQEIELFHPFLLLGYKYSFGTRFLFDPMIPIYVLKTENGIS